MSRSRVPGYREGLKVYQTFTCPWTESAWTSASLRMNCSVGGDQPFNHYYCIPNAERTHFVEFCYDRASMKTEKGNCWELGGIGYLNQVDCTNFVKGCPDYTYLSEQVYKRDIGSEPNEHLLNLEENKGNTNPTLKSQPVNVPERDIIPVNVKGHISHLYLSKTGDIWASNDRDNNKRVVVVDKNNKFRFIYPEHDHNGFAPYGISTDKQDDIQHFVKFVIVFPDDVPVKGTRIQRRVESLPNVYLSTDGLDMDVGILEDEL
uniref:Uncharacterized protein n=1 Tax=Magallana gigas TaxID=29159 RepID=A0A8W8IM44_MAGGI